MKRIDLKSADYEEQLNHVCSSSQSSLFDPTIEQRTRAILEAVQSRGIEAVLEFTKQFDGADLDLENDFRVSAKTISQAKQLASPELKNAVRVASANIAAFAESSKRRNWQGVNAQGAKVGEKFDPFHRVGIYIPGGSAPLVSTALMTIVLAKVAGCREIIVCTPCNAQGEVNPALLYAADQAGATEIYRVGGAQAIAALALGAGPIRPTQKIFGPGNAYVVAAKRLLFGHVAIDLLPGPSEVLVLADAEANPEFIAADLLAQAEHGSGHERVWLVTPSKRLMTSVERAMKRQIKTLSRAKYIEPALENNGWMIQCRDLDHGAEIANRLAPEHCELHTQQQRQLAKKITTAGALFLGGYSPTVTGDYLAGPSHTLPTGGAGLSFAGLTVDQFQRRTSVVQYTASSLKKSLPYLSCFAEMEGLDAHGRSAEIRFDDSAK